MAYLITFGFIFYLAALVIGIYMICPEWKKQEIQDFLKSFEK